MNTEAVPAGDDPRRLLSDVRALAHRVRLDQRVTPVALLVLAVVTFVAIPITWYLRRPADCVSVTVNGPGGASDGLVCKVGGQLGPVSFYWPVALLLAYTVIAVYAVRVSRSRGLAARVLPYALTGAALVVVGTAGWLVDRHYLLSQPPPVHQFPYWRLLLSRLDGPAGTIGIALLLLAWLERHAALLVFTLGYLAVVLVPISFGWNPPDQWQLLAPEVISGAVLLLGAAGFAAARRRHR
jgi:hypothetical protein